MIDKFLFIFLNLFIVFFKTNLALIDDNHNLVLQQPSFLIDPIVSDRAIRESSQLSTKSTNSSNLNNESNLVSNWINQSSINFVNLKDNHEQLTVHYAGKNSPVIICLAKNRPNTKQNQSSAVYISHNYGQSFEKVNVFKTVSGSQSLIHTFYISPILNSYYLFVDRTNKCIFITKDFGKNFQRIDLKFTPKSFQLHPSIPNLVLAQSLDIDQNDSSLYLSENFGLSWKKIAEKIGSYSWSVDQKVASLTDMRTIFLQRYEPSGLSTLISSSDFFSNTINMKIWLTNVEKVQFNKRFMFATRPVHLFGSPTRDPSYQLWLSVDRKPFSPVIFDASQEPINYHVADISNDVIFLCVTFKDHTTNLYTAGVPNYDVFTLSLENVVFFNPKVSKSIPGINYEIIKDREFVDLHRVAEVRGTYIISKWKNDSKKSTNHSISEIITLITYDLGNRWHTLKPPSTDSFGHPIDCANCSLHLIQRFMSMNSNSRSILSRDSSVGFIIGTGVIGDSPKGKQNIYLSIDAGNTWRQILSGNYLYSFGDFGAIIVAVEHFTDSGPTNELYYSIDDGYSFSKYKFHHEKIKVYGLLTEPGERTAVFTIFGSKENIHEWVVIQVNLTEKFDSKCHMPQDYKEWSPHDYESKCLLGSTEIYLRRIASKKCFNGNDFVRPVSRINCPCKHSDYECDYGYVSVTKAIGFRCVNDKSTSVIGLNSPEIPIECQPGLMFNKTKGYRKIPGDTCEGGEEEWYSPHLIPCPFTPSNPYEFILFVQRQEISMIPLNNENFTKHSLLPRSFLSNAIAADFDIKNNCLFWSDIHSNRILRYCFDGKQLQPEIFVDIGLDSVEGIAFNQINGHLYFVNGNKSKVEIVNTRINFEGRMRRTILSEPNTKKPRGIAIDPIECYLFITDWSLTSAIIRSDLDGENVKVLFNSNTVTWPNGITADYMAKRIYWVDAKLDYIASSLYDGKDFKYLIRGDQAPHPFALGVFKDFVFYDDWILNKLILFSKTNATVRKVVLEDVTSAMDLKIVFNHFPNHTNICNQNTTCSHLCVAKPFNSFRCLCPDEFIITQQPDGNEKCSCAMNRELTEKGACRPLSFNASCLSHEFECDNGICVSRYWECDDDDDCGDGSDEKYCYDDQCKLREFRCKTSGKCIQDLWICDHEKECEDGSDEDLALCASIYPKCDTPDKFQCNNHRCIDKRLVCDSIDHCRDGSDEIGCQYNSTTENITCEENQFRCDNGQCLHKWWRCDGYNDCYDKSDEKDCHNECPDKEFRCPNGICIDKLYVCDYDKDCSDGSDELNCNYSEFILNNTSPGATDNLNHFNRCPNDWFHCQSGNFCIPSEWYCDGNKDCLDSADELQCPEKEIEPEVEEKNITDKNANSCKENMFFCAKSNQCIFRMFVCDGSYDCREGEDEHNCPLNSPAKCPPNYFSCFLSLGCIPPRKVCDGKIDCFDGSEEWGCLNLKVPVSPICLGFNCKNGGCIETSQRCDQEIDCIDGSDEDNCDYYAHNSSVKVFVRYDSIRPDSFTIYWTVPDKNHSYLFMPSYTTSHDGRQTSLFKSDWITDTFYTFKDLRPGTTYRVSVFTKFKHNETIIIPKSSISVTTESIDPSPPQNFTAQVINFNQISFKWTPPKSTEEPIKGYRLYQSPPQPPKVFDFSTNGSVVCCFEIGIDYTFWVTSLTKNLESDSSKKISISLTSIARLKDLSQKNVTDTSVSLAWESIPKNISKWLIIYTCEDYFPSFSQNISVENNQSDHHIHHSAIIENLSPGVNYQFKLYPFIEGHLWLEGIENNVISVRTLGIQLPSVYVQSQVIGSRISLWWSSPSHYLNMSSIEWEYAIYMGDSRKNFQLHAQTKDTKIVLKNLISCQLYMIEVRVIKPFGIGPPPLNECRIMTEFDPTSPPKKIRCSPSNEDKTRYTIIWESSCPKSPKQKIGYIVSVYDTINKYLDRFRFQPNEDVSHSFELSVHYGAIYEIKVATTEQDARWSDEIILNAPPMPTVPMPYAYIDDYDRINIVWKSIDNFPKDHQLHKLQYKVYVHNEKDVLKGQFIQIKEPPAIIEPKVRSDIYFIRISLVDNHGYSGPLSETYRLYTDNIPLSSSSYVYFGKQEIFLIIMMLVSVILISYIIFKKFYRQPTVPFISSLHYNSRSESATMSSYENCLQDEDNHIYSDDEPLVLA